MGKKGLFIAVLQLIFSFLLLSTVIFAWFSLSDHAGVDPVEVSVTDGAPLPFEIKYYTKEHVYKYDSTSNQVLVYDTVSMTYILPEASPFDSPTYTFNGVFINHYDPIVAENNLDNNLIVELFIDFNTTEPITFENVIAADPFIASAAVTAYPYTTSRPYYASEVTYVQSFVSKDYNAFSDGDNKYDTLNTLFNQTDINSNLIYPKQSFYNNDIYGRTIDLGAVNLTTDIASYKLYYNFSYYETKIDAFLAFENITVDVDNMDHILFFQDMKFKISVGGN